MNEVPVDASLVGYCGLYCGACPRYLMERCSGCHDTTKATWCKIRTCCRENELSTCAECTELDDPRDCRKFHNLISRIMGFVLRSDRRACVLQIRELGLEDHAKAMAELGRPALRPGR